MNMRRSAAFAWAVAVSVLASVSAHADVESARVQAGKDAWIVNGNVQGKSEAKLLPGQGMQAPGQAGSATVTHPPVGVGIGDSSLTTGGKHSSSPGAGGPSGITTGSSAGYTTGNRSGTSDR